jgi:hypothetical protein
MNAALSHAINLSGKKLGRRQHRQARQLIERTNRFKFLLPGRIAEGKEKEAELLEEHLWQEFNALRSKGYSRMKAEELVTKMNVILIGRVLK